MIELFTPRRVSPAAPPENVRKWLRYSQRAKGLSSAEEAAIRALAATKSVRSLAVDFGVSHETVRRVARDVNATGA